MYAREIFHTGVVTSPHMASEEHNAQFTACMVSRLRHLKSDSRRAEGPVCSVDRVHGVTAVNSFQSMQSDHPVSSQLRRPFQCTQPIYLEEQARIELCEVTHQPWALRLKHYPLQSKCCRRASGTPRAAWRELQVWLESRNDASSFNSFRCLIVT